MSTDVGHTKASHAAEHQNAKPETRPSQQLKEASQ
jgi:hypothetical protein